MFKNYLLALSLIPSFLYAQDSAQIEPTPKKAVWQNDFVASLNFAQAAYSKNWVAGANNTVSISSFVVFKSIRKTETTEWTNDFQLLYGTIKNEGNPIRKSADRIFFDSKYAKKLTKKWNFYGSFNFMSQFDAGFKFDNTTGVEKSTRISGLMSPGYLTEAIGFEYKPVSYFSTQLGFGALRQTFVTDQSLYDVYDSTAKEYTTLYGVDRGENMRQQVVFQFVADFDKEIAKNIILKWRYMGLLDYARLEGKYIVSRLDASIVAKVNNYLSTKIATVVLYDFDQDKDIQFSEILSIGLLYRIKNFEEK